MNKFVIPSFVFNRVTLLLMNFFIRKMHKIKSIYSIREEEDYFISRDGVKINVKLYSPSDGYDGILLYFHGGGFFLEGAPYIYHYMEEYAFKGNVKVVFAQYRTSDKSPFPTPFYDAIDALKYTKEKFIKTSELPLLIGGDSAGGHLALGVTKYAIENNIKVDFNMLLYPVINNSFESESMKKYADSPLWNARLCKKMWKIYLRNGIEDSSYIDFLKEDASLFPPTLIELCEMDSLFSAGDEWIRKLLNSGVQVERVFMSNLFHGYDIFYKKKEVQDEINVRVDAINKVVEKFRTKKDEK